MIKLIVLNCLLIVGTTALAQSKDEAAVANATEKLRLAMVNADQKALESLVSEKLSYGHSGGHVEGKQEFVEKIVSGKSDFVSIDLSEQSIILSGNTAIVRHILKATTNDGGKPGEVQLKVLLVWQKQGKNWTLIARQAVKFVP
jgi:ketosteroid isomerase-like protein